MEETNLNLDINIMFLKKKWYIFTFFIDPLCNGSTADFGSVSWGSSPYGSVALPACYVFIVSC